MSSKRLGLPKIIGHRGVAELAPENTLLGFKKAAELGLTWVEFDVMLSADRVPLVIHDFELERTTNGFGKVSSHAANDIMSLNASMSFKFSSLTTVPSLQQVLECLASNNLQANIELKCEPGRERLTVERVLAVVNQSWPNHLSVPLFSSFNYDALVELRKHDKDCCIGVLLDEWQNNWLDLVEQVNAVSLHLNAGLVTDQRAQAIKSADLLLLAYTVNDLDSAKQLWDKGVDAIFTDNPNKLSE